VGLAPLMHNQVCSFDGHVFLVFTLVGGCVWLPRISSLGLDDGPQWFRVTRASFAVKNYILASHRKRSLPLRFRLTTKMQDIRDRLESSRCSVSPPSLLAFPFSKRSKHLEARRTVGGRFQTYGGEARSRREPGLSG